MNRLLAALLAGVIPISADAQTKIDPPQSIRATSETSMAQVRACLSLAKEISDLTDTAKVAEARGDTDGFNATVDPYNRAIGRWNSGCTKPYDPADLIRAENESGMRLCTFTTSPCLSEPQRQQILAQELARQSAEGRGPQGVAMQKTTGVIRTRTPSGNPAPIAKASPQSCVSPTTPEELAVCVAADLAWQTEAINTTYNALRSGVDAEKREKLKSIQLAWIAFRDLSCELEASLVTGEPMQSVVRDGCLARMTVARNEELKKLSDEIPR